MFVTLVIVAITCVAFVLIASERWTNINKAAVAIFAGTVGWVLYVCYGMDYVTSQHPSEYTAFLDGAVATASNVKEFIAGNVFLKYVGRASEIVIYLLATMTIVEILNNNGCFDFVVYLMRSRKSRHVLWSLALCTFIISANLDNLTTTVMVLTLLHGTLANRRQRMIVGAAIVLAANFGGALTVIGDPIQLVLWNHGAVTATNYSMTLLLPCLVAWVVPTWLLGRMLPERLDMDFPTLPYRGNDTNLNVSQRLVMLFVGIGGLWFIPSFHSITKLSPFLGALCVLGLLWIVNEMFNHKLMNADQMIHRRIPRVLQYGTIQMMLYVMGIMLLMGVVTETGFFTKVFNCAESISHDFWPWAVMAGAASMVVDNFATAMSMFQMHPVGGGAAFVQDGAYWKAIAYCVAAGSNILAIGSLSGVAYLKAERVRIGWYVRNVGGKALLGALLGLALLYIII